MECKRIIFRALLLFSFAIGTAYIGYCGQTSQDSFVKVKLSMHGNWNCIRIDKDCSGFSNFACQVKIEVSYSETPEIVKARNSDCERILTHESDFPFYIMLDDEAIPYAVK